MPLLEIVVEVKIYKRIEFVLINLLYFKILDPSFLLSFLRAKKFSVPRALEVLERNLMARQKFPQWYQKLDIEEERISSLFKNGYIIPLTEKDAQGRQIILTRAGQINPDSNTSTDAIRLNTLIYSCCLEDIEIQIAGFIHIIDAIDVTSKHLGMFSISDMKSWLLSVEKAAPIRQKEYHFVNFPSITNSVVEFGTSLLSEKLKKRIFIHKDMESLKQMVDIKILPTEYGGEVAMAEMLNSFENKAKNVRENIRENENMYIDEAYSSDEWISEQLGTFTKLDID